MVVSPADFGGLSSMVAAVALCVGIAEGGLDSSASLLIGSGLSASEVVASLLAIRVAVAAVLATSVLPLLLLPLVASHAVSLVVLAGMALVLASVAATSRVKVRVESPDREMRILTTDRVLSTLPFAGGLAARAEVAELALLFLGGQALGALATIALARPPRAGYSLASELLRQAVPFIVSTVAANVTWRVGIITLAMVGAAEQAGYLATAIYPVQAFVLVSAGSAPLILIGGRQGLSHLRPRTSGLVLLLAITGLVAGGVAMVGPHLPVAPGVVWTLAVLICVLPAALANPLVGAGIRVHGQASLVAVAAATGAAVAVLMSFTVSRAPVQALGIVLAEVTVLTIMLVCRSRRATADLIGSGS